MTTLCWTANQFVSTAISANPHRPTADPILFFLGPYAPNEVIAAIAHEGRFWLPFDSLGRSPPPTLVGSPHETSCSADSPLSKLSRDVQWRRSCFMCAATGGCSSITPTFVLASHALWRRLSHRKKLAGWSVRASPIVLED